MSEASSPSGIPKGWELTGHLKRKILLSYWICQRGLETKLLASCLTEPAGCILLCCGACQVSAELETAVIQQSEVQRDRKIPWRYCESLTIWRNVQILGSASRSNGKFLQPRPYKVAESCMCSRTLSKLHSFRPISSASVKVITGKLQAQHVATVWEHCHWNCI